MLKGFKHSIYLLGLKIFLPVKSSRRQHDSPSVLRKSGALWRLSSNCTKHRKANRNFIYPQINAALFFLFEKKVKKLKKKKGPPLGAEVHKLGGELVSGELRRRFLHHLLQLLERRSPRVVRETQDGQLDLTQDKKKSQKRRTPQRLSKARTSRESRQRVYSPL